MRRVQGSNLLELALIGFRNQRITVLPTLQKVSPARFERATYCSASNCSIQLSYGLINLQVYILPYK